MNSVNHPPQPTRLPSLDVLLRLFADLKNAEPYPARSRFGATTRFEATTRMGA